MKVHSRWTLAQWSGRSASEAEDRLCSQANACIMRQQHYSLLVRINELLGACATSYSYELSPSRGHRPQQNSGNSHRRRRQASARDMAPTRGLSEHFPGSRLHIRLASRDSSPKRSAILVLRHTILVRCAAILVQYTSDKHSYHSLPQHKQ